MTDSVACADRFAIGLNADFQSRAFGFQFVARAFDFAPRRARLFQFNFGICGGFERRLMRRARLFFGAARALQLLRRLVYRLHQTQNFVALRELRAPRFDGIGAPQPDLMRLQFARQAHQLLRFQFLDMIQSFGVRLRAFAVQFGLRRAQTRPR